MFNKGDEVYVKDDGNEALTDFAAKHRQWRDMPPTDRLLEVVQTVNVPKGEIWCEYDRTGWCIPTRFLEKRSKP